MQNVPLEAAHLFDFNTDILGSLLAAVQPEKAASAAKVCFGLKPMRISKNTNIKYMS